jgi:hypothetical protein
MTALVRVWRGGINSFQCRLFEEAVRRVISQWNRKKLQNKRKLDEESQVQELLPFRFEYLNTKVLVQYIYFN